MKIYIEDIISNGIIEQEKRNGSKVVNLEKAIEYGEFVVRDLNKLGIKAELFLSDDRIKRFEYMYYDFFDKIGDYRTPEFVLNDGKNIDDLVYKFRSNLNINLIESFTNKDLLQEVFGDIELEKTLLL